MASRPERLVLHRSFRRMRHDPVDRDQRAVDDHVGHALAFGLPQRCPQLRRPLSQQLNGFVDIPPARRTAEQHSEALGLNVDLGRLLSYQGLRHVRGTDTPNDQPTHDLQLLPTNTSRPG
jgi:hypothetical protein